MLHVPDLENTIFYQHLGPVFIELANRYNVFPRLRDPVDTGEHLEFFVPAYEEDGAVALNVHQ